MKRNPGDAAPGATDLRRRDAAARRAAQTIFDRPLVLEAGAGTGKTLTLVARVIVWCMGPGWARAETDAASQGGSPSSERIAARVLQRVVAITFTEAAAAEMAERVATTLARIARGETVVGIDTDLLPDDAQLRCTRAGALMAGLDHLGVRTIHAFCRRLLSTYPIEAGLHPSFQVDADGVLQAGVIRDVIEAHLHEAYTDPGDPGFLALAMHQQGPQEINDALKTLVSKGATARDLDADPFADAIVDAVVTRLKNHLHDFERIEGGRLRGLKKTMKRVEAVVDSALKSTALITRACDPDLHGVEQLEALCRSLVDLWPDKNLDHLQKWSRNDFGVTEANALGEHADDFADCCAELHPTISQLLNLDPTLLNLARSVLGPLLAEVQTQLRARGIETFPALLRDCLNLLTDNPDVAARVRGSIDQLLVDEFQDTDQVQCGIIRILALDDSLTRAPSLFIVGDPKQSIYGWRSADLRAYDAFVAEVCAHSGSVHQLSVNFRSAPPILDEVERVIAPVMQVREGMQPAFQPLIACAALADASGFRDGDCAPIEHWVSWECRVDESLTSASDASRLEAAALASDALTLHAEHGVAWSEIAVLLRGTGDIEIYLGALREAGIPYVVQRDRSYYQRREVIEAWALVQCMLEPTDHVALITFLRSALVGVPDAALIPLWSHAFPRLITELTGPTPARLGEIDRVIGAALAEMPDDVPGLERVHGWEHNLRAAVRHLAGLRESFHVDPADIVVEKIRTTLLAEATEAARYLGRYRLANLARFFTRLLAALEAAAGDAHAVLRALRLAISEADDAEEARPNDGGEDAVVVTTIHQAKGLDFGHVYVMQLHKLGQPEQKQENDAGEIDGRFEYRLFKASTLGFARVEQHRREVEAAERVRTLYVAMTRAKHRLVLAGCWPKARAAKEAMRVRSHVELLGSRDTPPPDLIAAWDSANEHATAHIDLAHARWSFPALRVSATAGSLRSIGAGPPVPLSTIAADSARLRELGAQARGYSARRYSGPISEEAHKDLRELLAGQVIRGEARALAAEPDSAQRVALAAGTAVHRVLESFDLHSDADAELQQQVRQLQSYLPPRLNETEHEQAIARAAAILRRFRDGALWERFVALRAHVVARELPVLLAANRESGPVCFLSGAIDLVCRESVTGDLLIIDYKTDVVSTPEEIESRAAVYQSQGSLYVRAVQEALALETSPRFELWFLHAGVAQ